MFGRRIVFSVLMLGVIVATGSGQQPAGKNASLEDISWLSGCWEGRQGEAIIEEIWSKPAGGSMLGLGRTVKAGKTSSFEFMQFREQTGSLVFMPQPQGGARVSFPLKDFFGGKLTFENKEHDFPQRVIYERKDPALLFAAIEGTYKGKEEREEFQMKKVRCDPEDE